MAGELPKVREGWRSLKVRVSAPIPEEVTNETQAMGLARNAAVVRGQTALLNHILEKKTRSGRKLKVAEVPSLDLQKKIRGYIKGAKVRSTKWKNGQCWVTLVLPKSQLRHILRKN